jgi:hypothetical protein
VVGASVVVVVVGASVVVVVVGASVVVVVVGASVVVVVVGGSVVIICFWVVDVVVMRLSPRRTQRKKPSAHSPCVCSKHRISGCGKLFTYMLNKSMVFRHGWVVGQKHGDHDL